MIGLIAARFDFNDRDSGTCRSYVTTAACTPRGYVRLRPGDLTILVGLDDVALLAVLEIAEADAALKALADLAGILLETLERSDSSLRDQRSLPQAADF